MKTKNILQIVGVLMIMLSGTTFAINIHANDHRCPNQQYQSLSSKPADKVVVRKTYRRGPYEEYDLKKHLEFEDVIRRKIELRIAYMHKMTDEQLAKETKSNFFNKAPVFQPSNNMEIDEVVTGRKLLSKEYKDPEGNL